MHRLSAPVKLWYKGPMFRYERPQAGRQRQFHQVGVEVFGIKQPTADAEVILMAVNYLKALGLNDLSVELNSLGCPECREVFKTKLKEVIKPYLNELCPDCQSRYEKNPLRLLDCKVDECKEIYAKQEIQSIIQSDFICNECSEHFTELRKYLDALQINYSINKLLVRGLDYYNRTVFEIKSNNLGSQNAVCGGGRYDNLTGVFGMSGMSGVGISFGADRIYDVLNQLDLYPKEAVNGTQLLFVTFGKKEAAYCLPILNQVRNAGIRAELYPDNAKMKKQMGYANDKQIPFVAIVGETEMNEGKLMLKNMTTGEQQLVTPAELLDIVK